MIYEQKTLEYEETKKLARREDFSWIYSSQGFIDAYSFSEYYRRVSPGRYEYLNVRPYIKGSEENTNMIASCDIAGLFECLGWSSSEEEAEEEDYQWLEDHFPLVSEHDEDDFPCINVKDMSLLQSAYIDSDKQLEQYILQRYFEEYC